MPRFLIVGNHRIDGVAPGGEVDLDETHAATLIASGHVVPVADEPDTEPDEDEEADA